MKQHIPIMGVLGLLIGCSASDESISMMKSDDSSEYMETSDSADYGATDTSTDVEADGDWDDGFGSEQENDFESMRPATTDAYVFVANPDRNTVTRISVPSLAVLTVEVGVEPSLIETSSDYSRAVTFNKGSDDISVIEADTLDVTNIEIRNNLNQMKMSPDGNWAICYHDVNAEGGGVTSGGAVSYNAINIVDLVNHQAYDAIVGVHPHDVQFTEDSAMAVVVSDDYIASIDLTAETPSPRRIAIADDLINPPKAEEVLLDPQGRYAIVRQYGVDTLKLVDFDPQGQLEEVSSIDVGANPTDMDVSPSGEEAIVVARGANQIWIYDLDDPRSEAQTIDMPEGEIFGSLLISPDSEQGILYSTQSDLSRIGIWDRDSDDNDIVLKGLVKPVSKVGMSPTGETALIFHPSSNGDTPSDSLYYNRHALSLMSMKDYFSVAFQLAAEAENFASTPDGDMGFYTMKGQPYLEVIDYQNFVPSEVNLSSVPVHLGMLPETNIAFVSQQHDLGRISFYDADESDLQTVTGFELNSAVEH